MNERLYKRKIKKQAKEKSKKKNASELDGARVLTEKRK